jgi:hypothetical protein
MTGGVGVMDQKASRIEDEKVMDRIEQWFPLKHEAAQD